MHDHDRGLQFDVSTLMTRRRALQLVAAGGLAAVVGCGSSSSGSSGTAAATTEAAGTTTDAAPGATAEIPEETAGPFPADGSNGVNVLTESGIVRSDLTSSFGSASATAEGVAAAVPEESLDDEPQPTTAARPPAATSWRARRRVISVDTSNCRPRS